MVANQLLVTLTKNCSENILQQSMARFLSGNLEADAYCEDTVVCLVTGIHGSGWTHQQRQVYIGPEIRNVMTAYIVTTVCDDVFELAC